MREICQSGSMSGNRKQNQAKPDCGDAAKATLNNHRETTVTAPVLDSTRGYTLTRSHKFPDFLFCKSWIALVSFRRVRSLMVFFPFLKHLMAHSATLDRRERSLVENCFASARISSRYFASTTLSYSRNVSWVGSRFPASAIMDRSGPLAQRVDASLPM